MISTINLAGYFRAIFAAAAAGAAAAQAALAQAFYSARAPYGMRWVAAE
jgi:hypothetical protein